ncbi:SH3 domain-containing protein [Paenibacillus aestuarii]|uniref:SH3 domain-containing protein n=1 Tax=Paenibacillus aestuarii TaxID=516965 RepID=A0ABW0K5Z4_9BACL|nr:SH3 domain-containing protein [Paenibacillus aestuarii]
MLLSQAVPASAAAIATATVNKSVNFRADANTSAKVYGLISAGTVLPIQSANNYWVLVDYNGKTGYVSRSYVTIQGDTAAPEPVPTPAPAAAPTPAPAPNPTTSTDVGSKIVN